jgi:hypothetical protein
MAPQCQTEIRPQWKEELNFLLAIDPFKFHQILSGDYQFQSSSSWLPERILLHLFATASLSLTKCKIGHILWKMSYCNEHTETQYLTFMKW